MNWGDFIGSSISQPFMTFPGVDPRCSCTSSPDQSDDNCCPSTPVETNITVVVIDDPNHEVLLPQSLTPVFAVIVCKITDYENLNFEFDIRMSRSDEAIVSGYWDMLVVGCLMLQIFVMGHAWFVFRDQQQGLSFPSTTESTFMTQSSLYM